MRRLCDGSVAPPDPETEPTAPPEPPTTPERSLLTRAFRAARLALAFLTVIPQRMAATEPLETDLAASRFAYPLVGLGLGLALAAASAALERAGVEPGLSAFLLVAALATVSGGLHLDGLADTFDGLFLWGGAERRLTVMRDPHLGSHGVAAIVLVLLGKYAALSPLRGSDRALALWGAVTVARTLILVAAGSANYARPHGTGRHVVEATTRHDALGATLLVLAFSGLLAGWTGFLAGASALFVARRLTRLASDRLGGITGDILGALVELGELAFLLGFSLFRRIG